MELLRLNRNVKNCSRRALVARYRYLLAPGCRYSAEIEIASAGDENLLGMVGVGGFPISAKRGKTVLADNVHNCRYARLWLHDGIG